MSLFIINEANEAIQKVARVAQAKETVFQGIQRKTLEKLDKSILEIEGRYGDDSRPYSDAKPSQNWKVVKQQDSIDIEEVYVWLKIGIRKQVIGAEGATQLKMKPAAAKAWLIAMREAIAGFTLEDKAFHSEAIIAARPKSTPKAEGMNSWKYNPETDLYEASPEIAPILKEVI
jgi:hypothetical protein